MSPRPLMSSPLGLAGPGGQSRGVWTWRSSVQVLSPPVTFRTLAALYWPQNKRWSISYGKPVIHRCGVKILRDTVFTDYLLVANSLCFTLGGAQWRFQSPLTCLLRAYSIQLSASLPTHALSAHFDRAWGHVNRRTYVIIGFSLVPNNKLSEATQKKFAGVTLERTCQKASLYIKWSLFGTVDLGATEAEMEETIKMNRLGFRNLLIKVSH